MAKTPRARAKSRIKNVPSNVAELTRALKFVSVAQRDIGQPYQSHVRLAYNWAVTYDGLLTAACPIPEELDCSPHTAKLLDALTRVNGELSIALQPPFLAIRTGGFSVKVPCTGAENMPPVNPDPVAGVINDRIKEGFEKVGRLASDVAEHVLTASILLLPYSMMATDRHVMLEYWHGIDLPPGGFTVPKASAKAILAIDKPLTRFGYSENSLTFYYEDNSWIKTQLYVEKWPQSAFLILNVPDIEPRPLPPNFFEAVAAVAPHSDDGRVYLSSAIIRSHREIGVGAEMVVDGIDQEWCFNAAKLLQMSGLMTQADFGIDGPCAYFFGENIRGAVAAIV